MINLNKGNAGRAVRGFVVLRSLFIGGVMRLGKRTSVAVALTLLVLALGCSADTARAMVCNNGDNGGVGPITGPVDAALIVPSEAECTFGPTGSVNGDIEVEGRVNGNIQVSVGAVYVRGNINGNIEASSNHDVTVDGGTVEGNIKMKGNGDVTVKSGSTVKGNIEKEGNGDVYIESGSTVAGNVKCGGSGSNRIVGRVEGNIEAC